MHTLMRTTHTRAHTPTRVYVPAPHRTTHAYSSVHTHMTHQHACTRLSAHTCAHIPSTHMHTLVHIYPIHACTHLCTYTQPHTAQVLKSPHEQALSPPFLCGLSTHEICLWSRRRRDQGADQTLFFAQQCPGSGGGVVLLVVIGLMCPQHRGAGKDLPLAAPVDLEHLDSSSTQAHAKHLPSWKSKTPNLGSPGTGVGPLDLTAEHSGSRACLAG